MSEEKNNVLVLGSGLMSFPCVKYASEKGYNITVASLIEEELNLMLSKLPGIKTEHLDIINNPQRLSELVSEHDLVASLVPNHMHSTVAEHCIHHKKSLVTASFDVDEAMMSLNQRAKDAGIVIVTECGLDPGLDHMISKCAIDAIKRDGGTIQSYRSICGGLPSPKFADGPLKYKFSWYPKGMFTACLCPATFLKDGEVVEIGAGHIFDDVRTTNSLMDESIEFEDVPNRNAMDYQNLYDIPSVTSLYRGTLRYKGFSNVMKTLIHLGLTSTKNFPVLSNSESKITWREVISLLLNLSLEASVNEISKAWSEIGKKDMVPMETVFNLLNENEQAPKAPTLLDSMSVYLAKKLSFGPNETDLVVMRNEIEYVRSDGHRQRMTMDLVEEGQTHGTSAMSQLVGITVAAVATLILEGGLQNTTGVVIPILEEIYKPVLDKIAKEGIKFKTSVIDI